MDSVFWRTWCRAREALGLGRIRRHDLRHSFASWMLRNKAADLVQIRDLLNHNSLKITERYLHHAKDEEQKAANRMGAMVRRATGDNVIPLITPQKRSESI